MIKRLALSTGLRALLSRLPWLKAGVLAGVATAVVAGSFALGAKYEAGQQAQTRERVLQRELARMERIWDQDRLLLLEARKVEREVEVIYREVYREAEAVETPGCVDLGAEWLRLYNRAIDPLAIPAITR